MTTLGGNICIRNGFRLDYCWRETVKSLLEVCDKVVICDCDSDDGTRKWIDDWAATESRIVPVNFPWTNPERTNQWWPEWINYSRQHLDTDMHLQLDADELIHPEDHEQIRNARDAKATLYFQRLNFWSDPKHLIPEGYCCGTKVLKMAPANMPIPSDYPYEPANSTCAQAVDSNIRVFHYGFIRHREQFFEKAREVHRIWSGAMDERLARAEKFEGNWATMPGVTGWEDRIVDYTGNHPPLIHQWLRERGYEI